VALWTSRFWHQFRKLPKDLKSSLDSNISPHSWQDNGKCLSIMWLNNSSFPKSSFSDSNCRVGSVSEAHKIQLPFRPGCTLSACRSRHFAQQNVFLQIRQFPVLLTDIIPLNMFKPTVNYRKCFDVYFSNCLRTNLLCRIERGNNEI